MPGVAFSLMGEYLGVKLPLIVFTNRISFKVCLDYQLDQYTDYISCAGTQLLQFQEILEEFPQSEDEIELEIREIHEVIDLYSAIREKMG